MYYNSLVIVNVAWLGLTVGIWLQSRGIYTTIEAFTKKNIHSDFSSWIYLQS